jgi:ABC-2 type transport system ATP-binding protein
MRIQATVVSLACPARTGDKPLKGLSRLPFDKLRATLDHRFFKVSGGKKQKGKRMGEENPIIRTRGLTRDFKKTRAVDGLDLAIAPGELFGLVGPDGAGKTTTLRLLAGLLDVSEGEATVLGHDLQSDAEAVKPHIGYMAQQFSLYAELSVLENLRFFAELFDVSPKELAERTGSLLAFAGLTEFKDRRADRLSGGMQKKLALACTLVHQPQILLLDEPTTGVDPVSRREFWNILTDLHIRGTTILVSTPYMDEADRCSRVGLMYAGKLVECDSPRNIRGRLEGDVIEVQPDDWRSALETAGGLRGVREVQTYGESLHLLVDSGKQRLPEIEKSLKKAGIRCRSIRIAPARMEEAFISLIRRMES